MCTEYTLSLDSLAVRFSILDKNGPFELGRSLVVGQEWLAVSGYEADRSPALGAQLPVVLRGGARESHTCTLSLLQGGVTESVTLELMALLIRPGETGLMLSQTPQREA